MAQKSAFLDHLEELRKRILISLTAVMIFSGVAFFVARRVIDFAVIKVQVERAYFFSPTEAFMVQVKIAIFLGIFVAFPIILYNTWMFIGPGLTKKERKISVSYLVVGMALFVLGLLFAYKILIPFGLRFLLSFGTEYLKPLMNIDSILSFIFWCLLGTGFLFQLPLLVFTCIQLGIVQLSTVTKHRAEAIVAILVICAIITPTADMVTLIIIACPLILLFELSIIAARIVQHTARKRSANA